jgi:hypothetical protein
MMKVFSALTHLSQFSFTSSLSLRRPARPAVSDSTPRPYPGCAENEADVGSAELEPPGSSLRADSEPPDRHSHDQLLPAQLDPIERALQYGWFKKAVTIVVVAAAFRSAARARTVCDLLDDVVLPFVRVLYRKWRDDGGFFPAKAQAAYTELLSGDLSAQAASVQAPEPETLASDIDPEQLTIIPVGGQLNLESLPSDVNSLTNRAAQPEGGMVDSVAVADVATITPPDVGSVLELAAHVAHAAQHLTL